MRGSLEGVRVLDVVSDAWRGMASGFYQCNRSTASRFENGQARSRYAVLFSCSQPNILVASAGRQPHQAIEDANARTRALRQGERPTGV